MHKSSDKGDCSLELSELFCLLIDIGCNISELCLCLKLCFGLWCGEIADSGELDSFPVNRFLIGFDLG